MRDPLLLDALTLYPFVITMSPLQTKIQTLLTHLNTIVLDKPMAVRLAVSCILADGHLLLQDLPGMGKTTLAHALAVGLGLDFNRIQFTNDMLPADIVGMMIYDQASNAFEFRQGPIFSELLLADEINRTSPKTQSALLEAMEEKQVTQDAKSHPLPRPFFVIATQNPSQQSGVYPLPESQLDRFLMCLSLGYPSQTAERELLEGRDRRTLIDAMPNILSADEVLAAQAEVANLYTTPVVLDYIQALAKHSRLSPNYHGLSPRGVLSLKRAAAAHAYVTGHNNVTTADVQAVFCAVADHRLGQAFVPFASAGDVAANVLTLAGQVLAEVPTI